MQLQQTQNEHVNVTDSAPVPLPSPDPTGFYDDLAQILKSVSDMSKAFQGTPEDQKEALLKEALADILQNKCKDYDGMRTFLDSFIHNASGLSPDLLKWLTSMKGFLDGYQFVDQKDLDAWAKKYQAAMGVSQAAHTKLDKDQAQLDADVAKHASSWDIAVDREILLGDYGNVQDADQRMEGAKQNYYVELENRNNAGRSYFLEVGNTAGVQGDKSSQLYGQYMNTIQLMLNDSKGFENIGQQLSNIIQAEEQVGH